MRPSWLPERCRLARNVTIVLTLFGVILIAGVVVTTASDQGRKTEQTDQRSPSSATGPTGATTMASASDGLGASGAASSPAATITPPPVNAGFDYQIGEPYAVPSGIGVVIRDREEAPVNGLYTICYVNGFQAQPGELTAWKDKHDDLLLKEDGNYVIDGEWNEVLLDISTSARREALATIVGEWIDTCADDGFQAVEIDNLDSWTRSDNLLTEDDALDYAALLTARAHARGLAIGQKNAVEIASVGAAQVGFDFAIAESCADYEMTDGVLECQGFVAAYGANVLVIEYDSAHFQQACAQYGSTLSIVQRDEEVTAPGSSAYVFQSC